MNDNEMNIALLIDWCNKKCKGCKNRCDGCSANAVKQLIVYAHQQKAEIEELWADYNYLFETMSHTKSEAINELVKRLKDRVVKKYKYTDVRIFNELDNLAKEMVENITKIEHNSLCETETYKGGV